MLWSEPSPSTSSSVGSTVRAAKGFVEASGAFEVLDVPRPVAKSCNLGWVNGSSFT